MSRAEGLQKAKAVQADKLALLKPDYVGRIGLLDMGALSFKVHIKDVALTFGRLHLVVVPVDGVGSATVWAEKVQLLPNRSVIQPIGVEEF